MGKDRSGDGRGFARPGGRDRIRTLALLPILGLATGATPALEDHWLGSVRVKAEPGETVRSREGPDFIVRSVMRGDRESFAVYEGPAAAVDGLRREPIRRACGTIWYRLSTRVDGRTRFVGYHARIGNFDLHIFGDAASGDRRRAKVFKRRLVLPRCRASYAHR